MRLFADDAMVYWEIISISDSQILQQGLNKLTLWEKTWLMEFNPIKCEVLSVTRKRNPVAYSYSLHNEILRVVGSTKYFGVTINSALNWNRHISNRDETYLIQGRAAGYAMRRYHNTSSVTHMLDHLQWPLLSQRRSCLRLVFLYKIVNWSANCHTTRPLYYQSPNKY